MNTGLHPTTGRYADPVLLIVDDTDDDITEILHVACDGYGFLGDETRTIGGAA